MCYLKSDSRECQTGFLVTVLPANSATSNKHAWKKNGGGFEGEGGEGGEEGEEEEEEEEGEKGERVCVL